MFHVKPTIEIISWGVMCAGGLLLIALLIGLAAVVLGVVGEWFWRRCRSLYLLERMHWALADLQKHGKVLPRPDMKIGINDEA